MTVVVYYSYLHIAGVVTLGASQALPKHQAPGGSAAAFCNGAAVLVKAGACWLVTVSCLVAAERQNAMATKRGNGDEQWRPGGEL